MHHGDTENAEAKKHLVHHRDTEFTEKNFHSKAAKATKVKIKQHRTQLEAQYRPLRRRLFVFVVRPRPDGLPVNVISKLSMSPW